jgi:hypothetical protein
MIFKSESDVRVWVRIQSNGRARWIEHAAGGTPGLPDCWVPHGPHQVHLELKLADLNKAGQLRFTVRPQQRLEIMRMMHDAVPVGLLVGVKGTSVLLFVPPTRKGALFGTIDFTGGEECYCMMPEEATTDDFWRGVEFIHTHPNGTSPLVVMELPHS